LTSIAGSHPGAGRRALLQLWIVAMLATGLISTAGAQPLKTVTLYVGFGPGGGYDFYGRMVARHLGRHLPGAPTVVVSNMPGVSSILAANFMTDIAPRDGSAIAIVNQSIALAEAMETSGIRFKSANFNWIGRVTTSTEITVMWHSSAVKTIADAMKFAAPIAGSGQGASGYDYPMVLNNIVGTKFNVVAGYPSTAAMLLAMERGETEGSFASWNTIKTGKPEWLAKKLINIVVQYAIERHPELPEVPTMVELGHSAEDKQVLSLYASAGAIGRSFFLPPGAAPAVLQTMRTAFDALLKDPDFLADIAKTHADFDPLPGDKLQQLVAGAASLPPALLARARKARMK
jgi:tripartite-type tricarboxylate transporter receptor subunit TctC